MGFRELALGKTPEQIRFKVFPSNMDTAPHELAAIEEIAMAALPYKTAKHEYLSGLMYIADVNDAVDGLTVPHFPPEVREETLTKMFAAMGEEVIFED